MHRKKITVVSKFRNTDINADKSFDKRREFLLQLAISGRYCNLYIWLLALSYAGISKILRRQVKASFTWYPKEKGDIKMIYDKNYVLTDDALFIVDNLLKKSKYVFCVVEMSIPTSLSFIMKIEKTPKQVTKYTKRHERSKN